MARLSQENITELKERFKDNLITINAYSVYGNNKKVCRVDDVFRDEVDDKVKVYLEPVEQGGNEKVPLNQLAGNKDRYIAKGGALISLRKYIENNKDPDKKFYTLVIEWLDGQVDPEIEDVDIKDKELEWLKKHVTRIVARFPKKYRNAFERNFPGEPYKIDDNSWAFGFRMSFDEVDDIPETLLNVKNANGNGIDLDHKIMHNTSYIWHLVKEHPEDFHFSAIEE